MDATPSAVREAIDAATRRADYLVGKGYAAQAAAVLRPRVEKEAEQRK